MWPEDDRIVPIPDPRSDPELGELALELERAGRRAAASGRPSSTFAASLRSDLLAVYGPMSDMAPAASTQPGAYLGPVAPRVVLRAGEAPRTVSRPSHFPLPAWTGVLMAAVVLVAVVLLDHRALFPATPDLHVVDAVGATVDRAGTRLDLAVGMDLRVGDVVRTAADDGYATLALAGGETRLAPGSSVRIAAAGAELALDQLGGRAWHRVGADVDGYLVATADVTWTATGTAFDLDRRAAPDGGDEVRAIGIERDVRVERPGRSDVLSEGSTTVVPLGTGLASADQGFGTGQITDADGADPWLLQNARRDVALGFDVGAFRRWLEAADPTASPTTTAAPTPTSSPVGTATTPTGTPVATRRTDPTPRPAPASTPKPNPKPTPKPTPKPAPKPTPKPPPDLAPLTLAVTGCHGGFAVLSWSQAPAAGFDHYQSLRSTASTIAPVYPPVPPAVAPDALYAESLSTLGAIDAGLEAGGTYKYRTVAFKAGDTPYAASAVKSATVKAVKSLGPLDAAVDAGGVLSADWVPYPGPAACFSWYKLLASPTDTLDGAQVIWESEGQGAGHATVESLSPGTYHLRLEAFRASSSGALSVARTDIVSVTIP